MFRFAYVTTVLLVLAPVASALAAEEMPAVYGQEDTGADYARPAVPKPEPGGTKP